MVKLDAVRVANAAFVRSLSQSQAQSQSRSSSRSQSHARTYVAVFVGGTSGIGEYTVRALVATFARNTPSRFDGNQPRLRIYIVGRNEKAAERTIADCTSICPAAQFRFVKGQDLSLLRDVDRVCGEIGRMEREEVSKENGRGRGGGDGGNEDEKVEAKIDLLFMSQAILNFGGREGTSMSILKFVHSAPLSTMSPALSDLVFQHVT